MIPNISNNFNAFLDNISNEHFKNITIINITNNNTQTIYNNESFRKIINFFNISENENIFANDKNFIKNLEVNKDASYLLDNTKNQFIKFHQKGGIDKINHKKDKVTREIIVNITNRKSNSNNLSDQWWYKWYFNVPPCANIISTQSTGTCWVNAVINSLFMIEPIFNLIQKRYTKFLKNDTEYKIPIDKFDNNDYKLEHLIGFLVYYLQYNQKTIKNNDFIEVLAAKIKCQYEMEKKEICEKIGYGNGGHPEYAMYIVLKYLLHKDDYFFYSPLTCDDEKTKNDCYEKYLIPINFKSNIKRNGVNDTNISLTPFLLIFDSKFTLSHFYFLQKKIIFNNHNYELCSGIIYIKSEDQSESHVISGIICNGKSYIYDSNDIFVECEWYNGKEGIQKYILDEHTKDFYKNDKITFDYISLAVYIKIE